MSIFDTQKAKRKKLYDECEKDGASPEFLKKVKDDRDVGLAAQAMDYADGTLGAMEKAVKEFETAVGRYTDQLAKAMAREDQKLKIKENVLQFQRDMVKLETAFGIKIKGLQSAPKKVLPQDSKDPKKTVEKVSPVTSQHEGNYKKATMFFVARRTKHLDTAETLEKEFAVNSKKMTNLADQAEKAYSGLETAVSKLDSEKANSLIAVLEEFHDRAKKLYENMQHSYDIKLDKEFMKDRAMKFDDLVGKFGMHESQKSEFLKLQQKLEPTFNKAAQIGKELLVTLNSTKVEGDKLAVLVKNGKLLLKGEGELKKSIIQQLTDKSQGIGKDIEWASEQYRQSKEGLINRIDTIKKTFVEYESVKNPVKDSKKTKARPIEDIVKSLKSHVTPGNAALSNAEKKQEGLKTVIGSIKSTIPKILVDDPQVKQVIAKYETRLNELTVEHQEAALNMKTELSRIEKLN